MGTRERRDRSDKSDRLLSGLLFDSLEKLQLDQSAIALVAVGGFGRGELSPGSDLDIILLHNGSLEEKVLAELVNLILYPLWDRSIAIDHSVRTRAECREQAVHDVRVAQGLLDIRFIAGNRELAESVETDAREDWVKNAKRNWPKIRSASDERAVRSGELAFLLEPDLKEARGGLRDIQALRAIAAMGLVDVPLSRVAEAEALLAKVRDALHEVSGRGRDQLLLTEQDAVAAHLELTDADALMLEVAKSARAVDYSMDLTWHKLDNVKTGSIFSRRKETAVGRGLLLIDGELKVDTDYSIAHDPGIGLHAAAVAAQRGADLSVESAIRLAEDFTALDEPWPRQSREDLVTLIGAGSHMIRVFEALDQEGLIERWIPEWGHVRFLPQRNVLHRHTVDRHMLETAVRAAALTRKVHRPDLLLISALFHDIGKGYLGKDHSEYGEILIADIGRRLGFSEKDVHVLALLVKHHLLLPTVATRRDLDDPATIATVVEAIGNPENLELLHCLSIADGEATGRTAWSDWKAGLVADLVHRALAAMSGIQPAKKVELTAQQIARLTAGELSVAVTPGEGVHEIEILAPDQVGLLSAVAGVLTISRMDVRSAKTRTHGGSALMTWTVSLDPNTAEPNGEKLAELLAKALAGEIDLAKRIDDRITQFRKLPGIPVPPPVVSATNDIATNATVIEVRMHDRPGVLFTVAKAIARFGVDINAAIVATLGAEAFDTLYVCDLGGAALSDERAKLLASQLENILLTQ
jgi:[protein-PII] uridylyltransferase